MRWKKKKGWQVIGGIVIMTCNLSEEEEPVEKVFGHSQILSMEDLTELSGLQRSMVTLKRAYGGFLTH